MRKITYKNSGVDIAGAAIFKSRIKALVRKSFTKGALQDIGGFGSFFALDKLAYREPVLVSSTDGVGTKLKIASLVGKHDSVGIDAVAMNVNDILCTGARPLFFLDYLAYSKVGKNVLVDIVKGITAGCIQSGCVLIGGETAQMPGIYKDGEYDIAGFCTGIVERKDIIDGSRISAGDAVIGIESNGLHSNGYSLVRNVLSLKEQRRMKQELMRPTRIYVKPILSLLRTTDDGIRNTVKGISHITGGAFYDKISRILADNVGVRIRKGSWPVPPIFGLIQKKGGIEDEEMYHTLNMGIGMVLIVSLDSARKVMNKLVQNKLKCWKIGEVVKGNKTVEVE